MFSIIFLVTDMKVAYASYSVIVTVAIIASLGRPIWCQTCGTEAYGGKKKYPPFFNESVFFLLNVEIYLASKTYRLWLVVHATPWSTKKGIEKGSQSYQIGLVFLKDSIALLKTSFLVLLFLRRALSLSLTHRLLLVRSRERSLNCCFTKPGVQQAVKVQIQLVNIEENSNWKKIS